MKNPASASGQQSPLLLKLFDNVLGREVEVDLGRQQRVMAQQALQRLQGDPFLDCRDGKGRMSTEITSSSST